MSLTLVLNGEAQSLEDVADGAAMDVVVAALSLKADRVAVELNGEIVPRRQWTEQHVNSGDKLEVVHFVGGGTAATAG